MIALDARAFHAMTPAQQDEWRAWIKAHGIDPIICVGVRIDGATVSCDVVTATETQANGTRTATQVDTITFDLRQPPPRLP